MVFVVELALRAKTGLLLALRANPTFVKFLNYSANTLFEQAVVAVSKHYQ